VTERRFGADTAGYFLSVRLIGWVSWGVEATVTAAAILCAPVVAIVLFATGQTHDGWIALAVFGGGLGYGLLLASELVDRPWPHWKDEA
jgi:hypothetical protein